MQTTTKNYQYIQLDPKMTLEKDHDQGKVSTLAMVIILVVVVKCVFLCFALMAVCYRYGKHFF